MRRINRVYNEAIEIMEANEMPETAEQQTDTIEIIVTSNVVKIVGSGVKFVNRSVIIYRIIGTPLKLELIISK